MSLPPERARASRQSGCQPPTRGAGASLAPERERASRQSGSEARARAGASLPPGRWRGVQASAGDSGWGTIKGKSYVMVRTSLSKRWAVEKR
ncbi:MAG: hypothetical protein LBD58_06480, partial [Treponema sp.]|nr:hypothetical protein [Treponema sp.]